MSRMVRKQIVIEPEQDEALAHMAGALGVSQSALIRRAIDRILEEGRRDAEDAVWAEAVAVMRGEGRPKVGSGGRRFTRSVLHER